MKQGYMNYESYLSVEEMTEYIFVRYMIYESNIELFQIYIQKISWCDEYHR